MRSRHGGPNRTCHSTSAAANRDCSPSPLGLAALIATPAHAAGTIANPYDCAPQPTLAQNFAAWNDYGQYTPVLNAGLENGATGWTLTGGASVVAGNEPWKIGGAWHRNALDLPAGSSAVTAPICIDETYPHFRLFARNAGSLNGALKIEVLYFDTKGKIVNTKPYDYKTGVDHRGNRPAWSASTSSPPRPPSRPRPSRSASRPPPRTRASRSTTSTSTPAPAASSPTCRSSAGQSPADEPERGPAQGRGPERQPCLVRTGGVSPPPPPAAGGPRAPWTCRPAMRHAASQREPIQ